MNIVGHVETDDHAALRNESANSVFERIQHFENLSQSHSMSASSSSVNSLENHKVASGGEVILVGDDEMYVDDFIARRIKPSASAAKGLEHGSMGTRDLYRKALQAADAQSIDQACKLRGIDVRGVSRNIKLIGSFSFLKE